MVLITQSSPRPYDGQGVSAIHEFCSSQSCISALKLKDFGQLRVIAEVKNKSINSGGVVLADNGYALSDWVIMPLPNPVTICKRNFAQLHKKTRVTIKCTNGLLKVRFHALKRGFQLKKLETIILCIKSALILHNLCITYDPPDEQQLHEAEEEGREERGAQINDDQPIEQANQNVKHRQIQLINTFTNNWLLFHQ